MIYAESCPRSLQCPGINQQIGLLAASRQTREEFLPYFHKISSFEVNIQDERTVDGLLRWLQSQRPSEVLHIRHLDVQTVDRECWDRLIGYFVKSVIGQEVVKRVHVTIVFEDKHYRTFTDRGDQWSTKHRFLIGPKQLSGKVERWCEFRRESSRKPSDGGFGGVLVYKSK